MARFETAGEIINQVLAESGLVPVSNPYSNQDPAVVQLTYLLTTVGRQLVMLHPWQMLQREHVITTQVGDSGKYTLPSDFDHMIDQTAWSRTQRVSVPGSVSPQIWQYLRGRNLVSSTIYLIFREAEGEFWVFPQPPDAAVPVGLTVAFEYISRDWVQTADTVGTSTPAYRDKPIESGDLVLFDPLLAVKMLKLRFKEARGADSTAAQNEALQVFASKTGQDVGAENINAAGMTHPYPYLDLWRNTPDTGYGGMI